ncbi:hypothetical protein [Kitasatospora sp. NPDC088351]|uniref:hypothetical protein n=1 Tax=Kitasatospora sp. NPDC088351 TaxID=3155180 RepID=UPI003417C2AA
MVAESIRDDGGRKFKELLSDGGAARGGDRDADLAQERGQVVWAGRLAARRPGKSQRDAWLVAVFMLSRPAMYSSSRDATGTGTGEAGSPSRRSVASPSLSTSSTVNWTMRVRG